MAVGGESVLKLTLSYDGAGFQGSQRQPGKRTVQEDLESALSTLGGEQIAVDVAGRTDRGVHAVGQVASCMHPRPGMSTEALIKAINALVSDDLAVVAAELKPQGFHARYDARWREYRFRIWSGPIYPLLARTTWCRRAALDIEAMSSAARRLVGQVNLATFTGGGEGVPWSDRMNAPRGTTRAVLLAELRRVPGAWGMVTGDSEGTAIEFRIVADGFLPQVVRTIVGALDLVGRQQQSPDWISELIEAGDRRRGPAPAPPQGLILWHVGYGDEQPVPWSNGEPSRDVSRTGLNTG